MSKKLDYEAIRKRWLLAAAESDMGLWWLADDLRDALGKGATEEQVRSATLEALRPLLESSELRPVTLLEAGNFSVWTGSAREVLARIESGWKEIGIPDIGDVVWFLGSAIDPLLKHDIAAKTRRTTAFLGSSPDFCVTTISGVAPRLA